MSTSHKKPIPLPAQQVAIEQRLLERIRTLGTEPPLPQRVFVNRALRLGSIDVIGFDLDWTLADYDRLPMEQLAFDLTRRRLVNSHGYPELVLDAEFRPDFPRRGLLIDKQTGAIVKMNRHHYVGRAFIGRRKLPAQERNRLFRREPIHPDDDRFYRADTLFELPELNLFAELVELASHGKLEVESYEQLFLDIRSSIDEIHRDGTLKERILANLSHYLPKDPDLILSLERLRLSGRKLLLLTNSEWFYTKALCEHLFNGVLSCVQDWRQLFDLVVCRTRKPLFFREENPFVEIDQHGKKLGECPVPSFGRVYEGGNRSGLMKLLNCPGERVLYVGDHIYGDVMASKQQGTWRTALIVRELEDELEARAGLEHDYRHLETLKYEIAAMGHRMDSVGDEIDLYQELAEAGVDFDAKQIEAARQEHSSLETQHKALRLLAASRQERISHSYNTLWGSLFKQGSNKSLFGAQVDDFACIYTSRVRNLLAYGCGHYFRVLRDPMMHETQL
ncbi:MAG: HAD family hydrolase [Planctomycetota bacterium]|nr:MAG: HAD family hydrolase [Planctomycetota bacterium]